MDKKVYIISVALLWSCVAASQCPDHVPGHCFPSAKGDLRPFTAQLSPSYSASHAVHMCRMLEHDIEPGRRCVVKWVPDHCPGKADLLKRLDMLHKLCEAMLPCPDIESMLTEAAASCTKDIKTKVENAVMAGADVCSVLEKQMRCVADKMSGCPAFVSASNEVFAESIRQSHLACSSAKLANFHSNMKKHRIFRRDTDCVQAASNIRSCSMEFVQTIMSRPTDTVFVCKKTREYIQDCIAANTRNCPQVRSTFIRAMPEAQKRVLEQQCGSGIFDMDTAGTTPDWYNTCDTQKAMQCTPRYNQHVQTAVKQMLPPSDLSGFDANSYLAKVKRAMLDLVDYNVLCRMMTPDEAKIRPCLADALGSCTNHQLREQHYTGFINMLDFCKLAQDCYMFSKANHKARECIGSKYDEMLTHVRASGRPVDQETTCRYMGDIARCVHDSYDVCPRAQAFIREKMFIGTGLQQMRAQCPGLTITFPSHGSGTPLPFPMNRTLDPRYMMSGSDACGPKQLETCLQLDLTELGKGSSPNIAYIMSTVCRKIGSKITAVKRCLQQLVERCNSDPNASAMQKMMVKSSLQQVDFCVHTEHCSKGNDVYTRMASCIQSLTNLTNSDPNQARDMCSTQQNMVNCMYEATTPCPGAWAALQPGMESGMAYIAQKCPNIHIPDANSAETRTGSILALFIMMITAALLR